MAREAQGPMSNSKAKQLRIGGELRRLYGNHAPGTIEDDGAVDSWPIYATALLARANYCLESITVLADREVDASVLCRVLYEHVVTFAWIAIDPLNNLPRAIRREYEDLRKANDALGQFLGDDRLVCRLDQAREYLRGVPNTKMPDVRTCSKEADAYWGRLLDTFRRGKYGFEGQYAALYRQFSMFTHPTAFALDVFVSGPGRQKTIGRPQPQRDNAVTSAPGLFAQVLLIASDRFGWPPTDAILSIFNAEHDNA